ncbi:helix-turn-helix domain-containing protein [Pseudobutyrivibrio sp. UC1225]|uniref:helix-turn-helix domain-containing protein n=1 Tax=Pseudobutyrivibrio sp. UC1225 TaxID=1798185 RepID=UPI000B82F493
MSEEQINEIEERYNRGESLSALAKEYGVTRQALYFFKTIMLCGKRRNNQLELDKSRWD